MKKIQCLLSGFLVVTMLGCGSSSKTLSGVYTSSHPGVNYKSGNGTPTDEEYTFKYSFYPNGACIYYDGQKDREYYTCTYQQTADDTYEATVTYRFTEEKSFVDSIVMKSGKEIEVTHSDTGETYTFTHSDEKISAKSILDTMDESDLDKFAKNIISNYWKNPDDTEYYPENSSLPTADSALKGLVFLKKDSDMYLYSFVDKEDGMDYVRAYILRCMYGNDDISAENGDKLITITKNGKTIGAVTYLVNDPSIGYVLIVAPF